MANKKFNKHISSLREKLHLNKKRYQPSVDEFAKSQQENPDDIIVKMKDVKISFKMGGVERVIINHLNLDIRRGEILGLVGESGSGKTTIGRAIIRINPVRSGEITYNNVLISGKIPKEREKLLKRQGNDRIVI